MNLVLLAGAVEMGGWRWPQAVFADKPDPVTVWTLLAWVNVLLLASALYPYTSQHEGFSLDSDGKQLLFIPSMSMEKMDRWHAAFFVLGALQEYQCARFTHAEQLAEAGSGQYPNVLDLAFLRATAILVQGRYAEAREMLQATEVRIGSSNPEFLALLLNNRAWADLLIGTEPLLAEADDLTAEAMSLTPWQPSCAGTRGTVLIEMGRIDEGMELVRRAIAGHEVPTGRAANAAVLALGYWKKGDARQAERWLSKARRVKGIHDTLGWVQRRMVTRLGSDAWANPDG